MDAYLIIWATFLIVAAILVPGMAVTAALLPNKGDIRWSERFGLSLVFGLTPFLILHFLTKNLNLQITETTTPLTLAAVTVAGFVVWYTRRNNGSKETSSNPQSS